MANTIELRKQYSNMLDLVYKKAALTSVLDGANELAREGANANEILIPKMDMDGLADYVRNGSGYEAGSVSFEYQTKSCDYDRGRKFTIDAMDDIETAGVAFGQLAGEFIRTKVVPELDAFRLSKYAQTTGIQTATGDLDTGKKAIEALRVARTAIENSEASLETCYLFITPALAGLIDDLDTTSSKKAMENWAGVIKVPTNRFNTEVSLVPSGSGGFASTGAEINFLIVDKQATIQYQKHTVSNIFDPSVNQGADGWAFNYRTVGIAEAMDNKINGIYLHSAPVQTAPARATTSK